MHSAVLRPDDRKDLLRKSGKEKFELLSGSANPHMDLITKTAHWNFFK